MFFSFAFLILVFLAFEYEIYVTWQYIFIAIVTVASCNMSNLRCYIATAGNKKTQSYVIVIRKVLEKYRLCWVFFFRTTQHAVAYTL